MTTKAMTTTAKLRNFLESDGWYYFTWTASGDDFSAALAMLKSMHVRDRSYDHATKTWGLRVGAGSEQLLAEAFCNGRQCVETLHAQLTLFKL